MTLQGRHILITGAGGALGSAVALACAAQGAALILLGRRQPPLEALYDRIVEAGYTLPHLFPCDLSKLDEAQAQTLAQAVTQQCGALHGVVHCAADTGALGPIADISGKDWQRLLHLNLTAPFLLSRPLLPMLASQDDAGIVFIDDPASRGKAYWGAYGVAKAGLVQLAQTLAEEWTAGGRLRVATLAPAPFRSSLRQRIFPGEKPANLPGPEPIAAFISHWLSASGRDLTAHCFGPADFDGHDAFSKQ